MDDPLIRDVSDTARWVAAYRARESERPDAVFCDPFARLLAGDHGEKILAAMPFAEMYAWVFAARTLLFDRFIAGAIASGVDLVVNLGAGLDARPYRMDVPASLRWVEVDLPGILDYKSSLLRSETARCALERIPLDISGSDARRGLFDRLARESARAVVITEGLLLYLAAEDVGNLAFDLHDARIFESWVLDLASPATLTMMRETVGHLVKGAATQRFAPPEGIAFFEPHGWTPAGVESHLQTAAALKRLPSFMAGAALPVETEESRRTGLWSGTCLLQRRP